MMNVQQEIEQAVSLERQRCAALVRNPPDHWLDAGVVTQTVKAMLESIAQRIEKGE